MKMENDVLEVLIFIYELKIRILFSNVTNV